MICRQTLLEVAAAGPAAGAAASLSCLLLGLGLSVGGLGGVTVEPSAFEDSLLVGIIGTCSQPPEQQVLCIFAIANVVLAQRSRPQPCRKAVPGVNISSPVFRYR